jgi:cellobiose-specific phosphotransferase system component IIA
VESITYEILEGIEEGMREAPERIEPVLQEASRVMTEILHHSAQEDICRQQKRLIHAKTALEETIEAEKLHMLESLKTFEGYAKERAYHHFEKSLLEVGHKVMRYVVKLAGEIKYNHTQSS